MKTSSGLLLVVLFALVVVIVALVIYFNTRPEEKPTTSTGRSPTLPTIGDLTIAQTLSPDSDSEPYTIEPYTIEYDEGTTAVYEEGDNEKRLSKNVTFTLNWKNKDQFDTVSKIEVEHYIREKGTDTALQTVVVNDNQKIKDQSGILSWNYAPLSVKIRGLPDSNTAQYSFIGDNMFKVIATANGVKVTLYDGTGALEEGETHPSELVIKPEDLTATIDMTESREVIYNVSLLGDTRATSTEIVNKTYTFTATALKDDNSNEPTNISTLEDIELIAQDTTGKEFKFRYGNSEKDNYGKWLGIQKSGGGQLGRIRIKLVDKENEDDAVKFTFMNSGMDKSDEGGDTYRMLRITVENCLISTGGCNAEGADKEPVFIYLYGSHLRGDATKEFLGLKGRSADEVAMRHWKLT